MSREYYVLGLQQGASEGEIKTAYKQLALKYHPDRNPGNEFKAAEKFTRIQTAYDRLLNPSKAQFAPMTSATTCTQSGTTTRPSRPFDPFDKPGEAPREYSSRNTQARSESRTRESTMRDTQRGTQGESRRDTQRGTEVREDCPRYARDTRGWTYDPNVEDYARSRRQDTARDRSSSHARDSSRQHDTVRQTRDRPSSTARQTRDRSSSHARDTVRPMGDYDTVKSTVTERPTRRPREMPTSYREPMNLPIQRRNSQSQMDVQDSGRRERPSATLVYDEEIEVTYKIKRKVSVSASGKGKVRVHLNDPAPIHAPQRRSELDYCHEPRTDRKAIERGTSVRDSTAYDSVRASSVRDSSRAPTQRTQRHIEPAPIYNSSAYPTQRTRRDSISIVRC